MNLESTFKFERLSIGVIINDVKKHRRKIVLCSIIYFISSILLLLSIPDYYKSEALVHPSSVNNTSKLPSGLGQLSSIAGLNIGGGETSKVDIAKALLSSTSFIKNFIADKNIYNEIMAIDRFDNVSGEYSYNELKDFLNKNASSIDSERFKNQAAKNLIKKLTINQDRQTGIIRIAYEHKSPEVTSFVINSLIDYVNKFMRSQAMMLSKNKIGDLESKISKNNSKMNDVIYSLIENEVHQLSIATASEDYVLSFIDQAQTPTDETNISKLIILLGLLLFFLVSVVSVLMLMRLK